MIEKSHAGQILHLGGTYTTLPNKALNLISDALTLGVWAYLISKPRDWSVNKKNVCEKLSIKERQYYTAIKSLKQIGLCREYCIRQGGRLRGKTIVIVSSPDDWSSAEDKIKSYQQEQNIKLVDVTQNRVDEKVENTPKARLGNEFTEIDKFRTSEKQTPQKSDISANADSLINKNKNKEVKKDKQNTEKLSAEFVRELSAAESQQVDHSVSVVVSQDKSLLDCSYERFVAGVKASLCHRRGFGHSAFEKGLNAICKLIREGRWQTPKYSKAVSEPVRDLSQETASELRELKLELNSHLNAMNSPVAQFDIKIKQQYEKDAEDCRRRINALHQTSALGEAHG